MPNMTLSFLSSRIQPHNREMNGSRFKFHTSTTQSTNSTMESWERLQNSKSSCQEYGRTAIRPLWSHMLVLTSPLPIQEMFLRCLSLKTKEFLRQRTLLQPITPAKPKSGTLTSRLPSILAFQPTLIISRPTSAELNHKNRLKLALKLWSLSRWLNTRRLSRLEKHQCRWIFVRHKLSIMLQIHLIM